MKNNFNNCTLSLNELQTISGGGSGCCCNGGYGYGYTSTTGTTAAAPAVFSGYSSRYGLSGGIRIPYKAIHISAATAARLGFFVR